MKLTQLANLGEFIGGVAVLVTLVYLAVQVRRSRAQQEAQEFAVVLQTVYTAAEPALQPDNARVLAAGLDDLRSLEGPDRFVFHTLMSRQLAANVMLSRSSDDLSRAMLEQYQQVLLTPGAAAWLEDAQTPLFKTLTTEALAGVSPKVS